MTRARELFERWWKSVAILLIVASLSFMLGQCDGRRDERQAWETKAARLEAEYQQKARTADAAHRSTITTGDNAIKQAREELDREKRNLPDESPSARRRARICRELREAARARGTASPTC